MKVLLNASLILALVTASLHAQTNGDEAKIRALATHWESAWNGHDMKALAALFADDADFVNVGARHWKGRTEIEAQHAARLQQFAESTWATKEVTVQFLSPDISLVHVSWDLEGDKDPDGTPREPRGGVFTWVVVKERGEWLIRAAQNTNRGNLPSPPGMK
jgi:uncharacterized protein (TIGR02246 family)